MAGVAMKPPPPGYAPLTAATLPVRLGPVEAVRERLGPPEAWRVREVGDGNLNLVFIVEGPAGSLVVKQALPYVRLVGESWPLPLDRSFFEHEALVRQAARDPGRVPEVYHYDGAQALVVMRHLSPHVILRKSIVAGRTHPALGGQMGRFLARTLFRGSALALSPPAARAEMALFSTNDALADITENLVFSDPYCDAPMNRCTPGLEPYALRLRADRDLKVAAQEMKHAFQTKAETLAHGDLHSGSIMVTDADAQVIDPEFALYGPFGFDVGMLIANYLLGWFAQSGHEAAPGARDGMRAWLAATAEETWAVFAAEFAALWRTERRAALYETRLFEGQGDPLGAEQALQAVLRGIFVDALGFCGVEMHRRIVGLAHVEDLEAIPDPARRVLAERRALALGRQLAVGRRDFGSIAEVLALAARIEAADLD